MKRSIILLCLIAFVLTAQAGSKRKIKRIGSGHVLFDKAIKIHERVDILSDVIASADSATSKGRSAVQERDSILGKALDYYQELIDVYPHSRLRYRALNNMASVYYTLKKYDGAIATCKRMLASDADDKETGGVGSGFMGEPYTNYKNRAAKMAASICLRQGSYAEALRYVALTKQYPYQHFCGNEYEADRIYVATLYGRAYMGLHLYDSAQAVLFPYLLYGGGASNNEAVEVIYELLLKTHTKEEIKAQLMEAFKNYRKGDNSDYIIVFFGTTIHITYITFIEALHGPAAKTDDPTQKIEELMKDSQLMYLLNR